MLVSRSFAASACALALLGSVRARADEPTKAMCVAASEGAEDLHRAGKLREARARLGVCIATACPGPVRADCAERMEELTKAIPTVVFEVKDGAGNDLVAVKVTFDGQPLVDKLDGTAIPVDPGEHHFAFEAEGQPRVEKTMVIREADKGRLERVSMGVPPLSPSPSPVAARPPAPAAAIEPPAGGGQRLAGLVVGGAGVAGLVVGGVLGLVAKSTYDHALKDECSGSAGTCTPAGAQDGKTASSQAFVSTVGFIAGAALSAGGAILFFTAPKGGVAVGPALGSREAGMVVRGVW
jgi:hypothetical protein